MQDTDETIVFGFPVYPGESLPALVISFAADYEQGVLSDESVDEHAEPVFERLGIGAILAMECTYDIDNALPVERIRELLDAEPGFRYDATFEDWIISPG